MIGTEMIAAERQRQIDVEGFSPEHDDGHEDGELLKAARAYVFVADTQRLAAEDGTREHLAAALIAMPPPWWPWERSWWKPSDDPVRNLVKAGSLIAAEIDRLQRTAPQDPEGVPIPYGDVQTDPTEVLTPAPTLVDEP